MKQNNTKSNSISPLNILFRVIIIAFLTAALAASFTHLIAGDNITDIVMDAFILPILITPIIWYLVIKPIKAIETNTVKGSERRRKSLLDSSADCICHISLDSRFLDMNRAGCILNGFDNPDEAIGRGCNDSIVENKGMADEAVKLAAKGETAHIRYKSINKKGEEIWWDSKVSPVRDEGGNIISTLRISRDITKQRRIEEKLMRLTAIIESTTDFVATADTDGQADYCNKAAREMLGIGKNEDISNIRISALHPEWAREIVLNKGIPTAIHCGTWTGETAFLSRNNREIPVSQTIIAHKRADGTTEFLSTIARDITWLKLLESSLNEKTSYLDSILSSSSDIAIAATDLDFVIRYYNPTAEKIFGYAKEDVIGRTIMDVHAKEKVEHARFERAIEIVKRQGKYEYKVEQKKDGETRFIESRITGIWDDNKNLAGFVLMSQDVSEKKKLEAQMLHSQKMEAIGSLAGGIAHDFSNLLTSIVGSAYVMQKKMNENDPLMVYARQILSSSERGSNLVQGLLDFSRKRQLNIKPVDLNKLVKDSAYLLERLIGEDIDMRINLAVEDLPIMADSGQIEQVLMNLATNARDAMPDGGILSISAALAEIDKEFFNIHGYGEKGLYAVVSVSDTGAGMDENTKQRIFEPFFTTKDVGKGTGLGLATVYGVVKQHNGYINVDSEIGKGTTFRIYLPFFKTEIVEAAKPEITVKGGTETILLAEDDLPVRMGVSEMLGQFGYSVIAAVDGDDAVRAFTENKDNINLVILDVIMPKKNGKMVYDEIKRIRPDIKVIFASGYTADIIRKKGILDNECDIITKPYMPNEFLKKIREMLDR